MKKVFIVFALILLSGCIPSINPIAKNETFEDDRVIGAWKSGNSVLSIDKKIVNRLSLYSLSYKNDNIQECYLFSISKLSNSFYISIQPVYSSTELIKKKHSDFYDSLLYPMFSFAKINIDAHELIVEVLNPEKLLNIVKEDKAAIKHEIINGDVIITDESENIQRFIAKYSDKLFSYDKKASEYLVFRFTKINMPKSVTSPPLTPFTNP